MSTKIVTTHSYQLGWASIALVTVSHRESKRVSVQYYTSEAYSVFSECTVYQSKVWTALCLYECTMKCTNCVCTSVWAACANTVNVVYTVVCFCDDTFPCYDELSTMHSLLCLMIHAMVWLHSSWCALLTCTLHVDDDDGYLMMMLVHTLWLGNITCDDIQH